MHDPFYDLFPKREPAPFAPGAIALVSIDLQYFDAHPEGWLGRVAESAGDPELLEPRWEATRTILPVTRRVQDAFRRMHQELIHVRVAYRTNDGRDAGTAFMPSPDVDPVPREPRDDEFLPEVAPQGDEIVFSKTSASVFNSTVIDKTLHRMGIGHLVVTGIVTDGCVELSARDAADLGYAVTLVTDACAASTPEAHEDALERMSDGGFITLMTANEVVAGISDLATV